MGFIVTDFSEGQLASDIRNNLTNNFAADDSVEQFDICGWSVFRLDRQKNVKRFCKSGS